MTSDAQEAVIRFLSSLEEGETETVTTHISVVVLKPAHAYKLKRAVRFPYLDFSTPEKRLAMCEREVALNRRFAPSLYIGVRRVTREADGSLALDGAGVLIDAAVVMRRFANDALFDSIAKRGELTASLIDALAERVAQAHDDADPDFARGGASAMRRVMEGAISSLRAAALAPPPQIDAFITDLESAFVAGSELIDARRPQGKVRRCHGDLTLRNICLFDGAPTLFDCLEFDDEIAIIDVLYDLAFLLMDLLRVDADSFANRALNRYLDARDETDGLPLLPCFMALRATIRAHVEASQQHDDVALTYFSLAQRLLTPARPMLVAIGGYSGAGKSTVAAALAPYLPPAPGARILNSDRIRKRLFGAPPTARLPESAYASDVSARVYREMFDTAARVAATGWPAIVDAVFDRPGDRAEIERIAQRLKVPFLGVWLDVDFNQRAARVDARRNDVSDATRDVLTKQMRKDPGEIAWLRVDAARDVRATIDEILRARPSPKKKG